MSAIDDGDRHTRFVHPAVPGVIVILTGDDDDDAKPYQERMIQKAIARVRLEQQSDASLSEDVEPVEITIDDANLALRYAIVIEWSEEDETFIVSVPDLPDLHTHGATRAEAAAMGTEVIALWISGARAMGVPAPPPRFSAIGSGNRDYDSVDSRE